MQYGRQCQQNEAAMLSDNTFIQQYDDYSANSQIFGNRVSIFHDNPAEREPVVYRSESIYSDEGCVTGYSMVKNSSIGNIIHENTETDHNFMGTGSSGKQHSPMLRRSLTSPTPHISAPYSPNSYRQSSPIYSNSHTSSPRSLSPTLSSRQSPSLGSEQSRAESGLLLLTEKVIECARQSPNFEIDLQTVESKLGVPRRRLYDITNVLEAVGLFTKPRHNIYKLNLDISSGLLQDEGNDENIMFYTKSQTELERAIANLRYSIEELIRNGKEQGLLYIDEEIMSKLCPANSNTIVAISAPIDTSITLNPNQHSYQLLNSILRTKNSSSENGMISVQTQVLDSHWSILLKHRTSQLDVRVINGHANILEEVKQVTSLPLQQNKLPNPVDNYLK
ncbi:E2f3 protein [Cryptosporidium ryanae]|uniref:E2f3 protein n=1 Tax=Cryptosporidium ryanae TaxID=515981 RepID=UPI00351A6D1B|nr:E2f3 protein [Cryptosporidium ryanae]